MRNRIAHGYLLVEPAIVRSTVDRDLPVMVEAVRTGIDRLPWHPANWRRDGLAWAPKLAPKFGSGVENVTMRPTPT